MGDVVGKAMVEDRTVVVTGAAVVATGVLVVNGRVNVVDRGVLARGPVVAARVVTGADEVATGVDEVAAGVEDTGKGLTCSTMGADALARYTPSEDPEYVLGRNIVCLCLAEGSHDACLPLHHEKKNQLGLVE